MDTVVENKMSLGHLEHSKKLHVAVRKNVMRPLKIVFLGAGSAFFQKLFTDLLSMNGADSGEMALVDIDAERLQLSAQIGGRLIEQMGKQWTLSATTDRRKVLAGADYIINCIEVSGTSVVQYDNDIPAKYGVSQCIGDTCGPGGLFKALRTVPVVLDVLKDVEEMCPNALFLNYTNPMSIICLAAHRASKVKFIGLCHSVQNTTNELAEYAGISRDELHWKCGGINHLAWFTELKGKDRDDLYPILKKIAKSQNELYEKDPIRFDVMLHLGYFVTESSGHFSEYLPYYRKRPDLLKKYCRKGYLGETGYYSTNWPQWRKNIDQSRRESMASYEPLPIERTWEYASHIIEAIETNLPYVVHGNVPNDGLIENLPQNGIVEVACLVNGNGVAPTHFGPLPPQCAGICSWQMSMYDLAAIACIERSREAALHSLMLDPLTAAVCCPAEITEMFNELCNSQMEYLPFF